MTILLRLTMPSFTLYGLRWVRQGWLALLLMCTFGSTAAALLPVPALQGRVIDQTRTLSEAERSALQARLARLASEQGTDMVVLLVPTTAGEDIAAYTHRVASSWKLGSEPAGHGLLLVLSRNDRGMRIEVSQSLEGIVTDVQAGRILQNDLAPALQQGDFARGIGAAVESLSAVLRGHTAAGQPPSQPSTLGAWFKAFGKMALITWGALWLFVAVAVRPAGGGVLGAIVGVLLSAAMVGGGLAGALLGWYVLSFWLPASRAPYWGFGVTVAIQVIVALLFSPMLRRRGGSAYQPKHNPWQGASAPAAVPVHKEWMRERPQDTGQDTPEIPTGQGGQYSGGGASGRW